MTDEQKQNERTLQVITETNTRLEAVIAQNRIILEDLKKARQELTDANGYMTLLSHALMWLMQRHRYPYLRFDLNEHLVPILQAGTQLRIDDANPAIITFTLETRVNETHGIELDFRPHGDGECLSGEIRNDDSEAARTDLSTERSEQRSSESTGGHALPEPQAAKES